MKIAILGSKGIPAGYGGFETFTEELSIRLIRKDFDITVYCKSDIPKKDKIYKGVRLKYVASSSDGVINELLYDLRSIIYAMKESDIIYMLGYGSSPFLILPRIFGKTVVTNVDGLEWKRRKWNKLQQLYLRICERVAVWFSHYIIADSMGIKEYIDKKYKINSKYIAYGAYLIQEGNESYIHTLGLEKEGYYLVVARMEPENNIDIIIKGFIKSNSIRNLVIVGNTNNQEYIKSLNLNSDPRIVFLGPIYDKEKLSSLRKNCYAYFHGHEVGGTNPSLLEALGCGNAVIGIDVNFVREVAKDAGLYFKKDVNHITQIINSIDKDIQKVKLMRKNAVNRLLEKYTWELIASQYEEFFHQIYNNKIKE